MTSGPFHGLIYFPFGAAVCAAACFPQSWRRPLVHRDRARVCTFPSNQSLQNEDSQEVRADDLGTWLGHPWAHWPSTLCLRQVLGISLGHNFWCTHLSCCVAAFAEAFAECFRFCQ